MKRQLSGVLLLVPGLTANPPSPSDLGIGSGVLSC